jgi:hypothetical protein
MNITEEVIKIIKEHIEGHTEEDDRDVNILSLTDLKKPRMMWTIRIKNGFWIG